MCMQSHPRIKISVQICTLAVLWSSMLYAAPIQIGTEDGLQLLLSQEGRFARLSTHGTNILESESASGIWIRDAKTGQETICQGYAEPYAYGIKFSGIAKNLQVRVIMDMIPENDALCLRGYIEDLSGKDRAVDLQLRLYMNAQGAAWFRDIQVASQITGPAPEPNTIYPFHGLVLPGRKGAFGLAVSAEEPAVYEFAYRDNAYYVLTLKYGLSPSAEGHLHQRANFSLLLYKGDTEWGFRYLAHRYYDLHQKWFYRRAMKNGMWLWNNDAGMVPNPWDYSYREGGPKGWEADEQYDIPTCPYIIVGQREIAGVPSLPETYKEQMEVFHQFQTTTPIRYQTPDSRYGTVSNKQIILNCGLFNGREEYIILPRAPRWVILENDTSEPEKRLTFPVNPAPDLYFNRPDATVAKYTLEWIRWLIRDNPFIDGIYIDSLAGWGAYFNCRRDHFPYAQVSLTYDPESKSPAIYNKFAHLEFLYAMQEILHPGGRYVFGNGIRQHRFFNAMALDIMGSENTVESLIKDRYKNLIHKRTAAFQKPYMLLNNHEAEWKDFELVKTYWKAGTFFGIYPGYNWLYQRETEWYNAHKDIINMYNPIIKQLNAAGWEPLTYARTNLAQVWIERFGTAKSGIYLTLLNTSDEDTGVTLRLDRDSLNLSESYSCMELVTGKKLRIIDKNISCFIPGKETRVLKIIDGK